MSRACSDLSNYNGFNWHGLYTMLANRKIMTFEKLLTELRAMFTENIDNVQIFFKVNKNEAQVYVNGKYWATYELE